MIRLKNLITLYLGAFNMQSFEQLRPIVGTWSVENFGEQETPYLPVYLNETIKADVERSKDEEKSVLALDYIDKVVGLGPLASLLGIAEEVGEMFGQELFEVSRNDADIEDALGDISIYLCDWAYRSGVVLPHNPNIHDKYKKSENPMFGIAVYMGKLVRCHLKRHQRIRGMHCPVAFSEERELAVKCLLWHLNEYAVDALDKTIICILNKTWNEIVSKRSWRTDAKDGGGQTP